MATNRSPCCKKSILARVGLDAKRSWPVHAAKCIFIEISRHLHQLLGYLLQNVVRFGAKRSAFWC